MPVPPWTTRIVEPGGGLVALGPGSGQCAKALATSAIIRRWAGRERKPGMDAEMAASLSRISCLASSVNMGSGYKPGTVAFGISIPHGSALTARTRELWKAPGCGSAGIHARRPRPYRRGRAWVILSSAACWDLQYPVTESLRLASVSRGAAHRLTRTSHSARVPG